jgi:hypothetical protein
MQLHANAALSLNQRSRMVRRVIEQGWSLAKSAVSSNQSPDCVDSGKAPGTTDALHDRSPNR